MLKAVVNAEQCNKSTKCFKKCLAGQACTKKAIFKLDPGDNALVEIAYCNACGLCLPKCPVKAVSLKEL
jgi:Pyruvate/2-oxoacid:ferredoxin oxidoreductase delta subunit